MSDHLVGQSIAGCQIVGLLGRGGMAVVYKAFQPRLGRYVALKLLPPHLAGDPQFVERFRREAMASARLRHPNIIQVFDAGQDSGYHYIVMELCEGGTLADRLKRGTMTMAEVALLLNAVASAMDHAHQQGIVHRDIKPSNILFTREGQPVITDFGIARILQTSSLSSTRAFLGTPEYVSPEQVEGRTVSARSDIYSLGIVLYQMLTGRPPFQGETPTAVLYAHVHKAPPPMRAVNPSISVGVENVVLRALAKNPSDRFATAGEMANALRAAAAGYAVPRHISRPPATQSPARGTLWMLLIAVPAVLLLGVIALAQGGSRQTAADLTPTAAGAPLPMRDAAAGTSTPLPALKAAPTLAPVAAATSTLAPRATVTAVSATATATTAPPTATPLWPSPTSVPPTAAPRPPVASRPTAGRIAFTEYYGTAARDPGKYDIWIANVDGSERRKLVASGSEPGFSPDGRRLALYSWNEGGVFVINPDGSGLMRVSPDGNDAWPTWSPDQTRIAYTTVRGGCWLYEIIQGNCFPKFEIYSIPVGSRGETNIIDGEQPSWGPDGRIIYKGCIGSNCGLMIVDPNNKSKVRISTHANDSNPIWSYATNQIVFASDRSGNWDIWICNPDGSNARQLTTARGNDGTPTWAVDGQWIYFRSDRDGEWAIWAMRADGSNQVKLFPSRVSDRWWWERISAGR